jgi:hypothetical protein
MGGYVRSIDTYPASVELNPDYEDRSHFYQERNYTYMRLIMEGKYYNVEKGWERDIHPEQFIDINTTLSEAIELLQDNHFLLVDHHEYGDKYVVKDGNYIGNLSGYASGELCAVTRKKEDPGNFSDLREFIESSAEVKNSQITYESTTSPDSDVSSVTHYGRTLDSDDKFSEEGEIKNMIIYLKEIDDEYVYKPHELMEESLELAYEVFDVDCSEKYGIVTLADINKRPVKEICYPVIADLANNLSEKLKEHYPDSENLLGTVHPDTIGYWKKDRLNGLEIHITEYMNLVEMQEAIKGAEKSFTEECGFSSKT